MKCICCGRKKKLFESFENLGNVGAVCAECSDIIYRIHDAVTYVQREEYDFQVKSIRAFVERGKASADFKKWFEEDFIKRNAFPNDSMK